MRHSNISVPWLVLFCVVVGFIWGNSMVPGEESSGFSLTVLHALQDGLDSLHIPRDWLTHLLVRKLAHFSEYFALGLVGIMAFGPHRAPVEHRRSLWIATALVLACVPCLDETIQLTSTGRAGQALDVVIDTAGIATSWLCAALVLAISGSRSRSRRESR